MPGMSMSSTATSGRVRRAAPTTSSPRSTSATTVMSLSSPISASSAPRIIAWSSASSTRIMRAPAAGARRAGGSGRPAARRSRRSRRARPPARRCRRARSPGSTVRRALAPVVDDLHARAGRPRSTATIQARWARAWRRMFVDASRTAKPSVVLVAASSSPSSSRASTVIPAERSSAIAACASASKPTARASVETASSSPACSSAISSSSSSSRAAASRSSRQQPAREVGLERDRGQAVAEHVVDVAREPPALGVGGLVGERVARAVELGDHRHEPDRGDQRRRRQGADTVNVYRMNQPTKLGPSTSSSSTVADRHVRRDRGHREQRRRAAPSGRRARARPWRRTARACNPRGRSATISDGPGGQPPTRAAARGRSGCDRRARRPRRRRRRARCTARSPRGSRALPIRAPLIVHAPRTRARLYPMHDDLDGQRRNPRDPVRGADRRARETGAAGELVGGRGRGRPRGRWRRRGGRRPALRARARARGRARSAPRRGPGRRARPAPRAPSMRIAFARRSSACADVGLDPRALALGRGGGQRRARGHQLVRRRDQPDERELQHRAEDDRDHRYWTVSLLATTAPGCSACASTGPSAHSDGGDERPAQRQDDQRRGRQRREHERPGRADRQQRGQLDRGHRRPASAASSAGARRAARSAGGGRAAGRTRARRRSRSPRRVPARARRSATPRRRRAAR